VSEAPDAAPAAVAFYGGSFNPPHVAHVLAAAWALASVPLARLLVVPTFEHPFGKAMAAYEHRVRMCELAFAELRRAEVSRIEAELGGASRTVRTLEALRAQLPATPLRLVIGSDLLAETSKWHAFDRIEALAPPLVVGRSGHEGGGLGGQYALPPISSTEVRRRLREGGDVSGLVPHAVVDYVRAHGLYRDARDGA
jgi:nicotinate-nucleotide adenylyltransferase